MGDKVKQRIRFTPASMKVREVEGEEDSRIIEGCAIVFDKETVIWDGKYEREREVIARTCITSDFLKEQDIKLNILHNRNSTVARNNKGVGTLNLELREDGLYFNAKMPMCDLGNQAVELVKNMTYTGCSFEFIPEDYITEHYKLEDGRDDYLITHTKFKKLLALTIAMDPVYEQTSIGCRELYEEQHPDADKKKAEVEAARRERDILDCDIEAEDALFNRY